jgi:hypothetical protein
VQSDFWYFLTVSDSGFCSSTPIGSARLEITVNKMAAVWHDMIFSTQKCAKVEIYQPVQLSGLLTQHKVRHTQHSTDVRQVISWEFRMFSKQFSAWMLSDSGIHDHVHDTCIHTLQHCKYSSYILLYMTWLRTYCRQVVSLHWPRYTLILVTIQILAKCIVGILNGRLCFLFIHFDGNSGMINHSMINQSNHGDHSVWK